MLGKKNSEIALCLEVNYPMQRNDNIQNILY